MRARIFADTYHGTAATKSPLTRGVSGGIVFFFTVILQPPNLPLPEGDKGGGTGIFELYMPGDPQK